jgi:hypothetical protein
MGRHATTVYITSTNNCSLLDRCILQCVYRLVGRTPDREKTGVGGMIQRADGDDPTRSVGGTVTSLSTIMPQLLWECSRLAVSVGVNHPILSAPQF